MSAKDSIVVIVAPTKMSAIIEDPHAISDGTSTISNVVFQNFPNPVINTTTIRDEISAAAPGKIMVFNIRGLLVSILAEAMQ